MTAITIQIQDQAVRAALAALAERVRNPAPVLQSIGEGIVQRSKARFDSSTGPDGQTWKPKKTANGRKTLVGDTGDLRRQIVRAVAGAGLTVSATAPYAAIHQFGGAINRKAAQVKVRHRTDAKGNLLRRAITAGAGANFGGQALVFGKASHKRSVERTFDRAAYTIHMPARPFLPVRADGSLYPDEQRLVLDEINDWLAARLG